jgi:NAD(P)-dependent dehydrogenase (short-subunit alcohol dehydrogenase family)
MNATVHRLPRTAARGSVVDSEPPPSQRVALVSGGNRGLGLEVVRQLAAQGITVLLGSRSLNAGEKIARQLRHEGSDVVAVKLDVTDDGDVAALATRIDHEYHRLDILVNNAGAFFDVEKRASNADLGTVRDALDVNLLGAWRLTEAMLPLMQRHNYGRIVNVSSSCGTIDNESDTCPAYRVSKTALNGYTRMLAAELKGSGVLVNAVCPGWVATDMGGSGGRPVRDGAEGIVWAACLPAQQAHMNGRFFRDKRQIAW